jgi:hypothetical protein
MRKIQIKAKGITRRWLVNVLSVTAAVIVVIEILLCVLVSTYYTQNAQNRARELCTGYNMLSTCTAADFPNLAREYIENFQHKDKIQVDIIDSNGNVIITSSGFPAVNEPMPDYEEAKQNSAGHAVWSGKSTIGESIMAGTEILSDFGSGSNGAVRWVISMSTVNQHVLILNIIFILIGVGIFLFAAFSGLYFINSIVRPVQEVSNISRRIAMGDFKARIDIKNDDEIGELCDGINYMASELEQTDEIKNSFISSVSHELRTPLTAIRGWGETAKMSVQSGDQELVEKALDVILTESERLSGLVEELLDFSRMQSGRLSVNMREMDLTVPLQEAVNMYVELAKQQGIELTLQMPETLPTVFGDPDRLKQVFINVIDNAIKYTNEQGQVLVNVYTEEGCITIKVIDTGVGIPEQDVDRVKEKFFKSNSTVRGSGIGLAVADEIMKQHNGLLFLESKEGVGTTVTIVVPVTDETKSEET